MQHIAGEKSTLPVCCGAAGGNREPIHACFVAPEHVDRQAVPPNRFVVAQRLPGSQIAGSEVGSAAALWPAIQGHPANSTQTQTPSLRLMTFVSC